MSYASIPNEEFQQKSKQPDAIILDVRTSGEFEEGFIPGAVNIDIMGGEFMDGVMNLDKEKTYLVYCRSGSRSASACSIMAANGFTKVFNLAAGIMFWNGPVAQQFENN